jgi:hypothetical protein
MGTYHQDTPYLRKKGCEDPWLFFEDKLGPRAKSFGQHWTRKLYVLSIGQDKLC